jgi:hypothetical protein
MQLLLQKLHQASIWISAAPLHVTLTSSTFNYNVHHYLPRKMILLKLQSIDESSPRRIVGLDMKGKKRLA